MTSQPLPKYSFPGERMYEISLAAVKTPRAGDSPVPRRHPLAAPVTLLFAFAALLLFLVPSVGRSARLVLDVDGYRRVFEGGVDTGMTVLDALNAAAAAGEIPFQFSIQSGRALLSTLDGHSAPLSIEVRVNGEPVDPAAIHEIPVRSADEITVRLAVES